MSEKQLTPMVQLFQLAQEKRELCGIYRSQSHDWRISVEFELYSIACEIAGKHLATPEILSAIFGDEVGLLNQIKNLWDFWSVVYLFALKDDTKKPLARSISEIRESNSRVSFDKERALNAELTANELVLYTVNGALLWSHRHEGIEVNPLWLEGGK